MRSKVIPVFHSTDSWRVHSQSTRSYRHRWSSQSCWYRWHYCHRVGWGTHHRLYRHDKRRE